MFKSKRHMILALKKKSGVQLSDAEVKELLGIEGVEEKKPEDKPKVEDKPAAAAPAAKPEDKPAEDKPKEDDKKKDGDPAAAPTMSIDDLGKALATMQENMNMIMEALASLMDSEGAEDPAEEKPAEEGKGDDAAKDPKKEDKPADEEEDKEMNEDEMEKELEKTIAELESFES